MKKIILLISASIFLVSCKDNSDEAYLKDESLNPNQYLKEYYDRIELDNRGCSDVIIYKNLNVETPFKVKDFLKTDPNDIEKVKLALWLKQNGDEIVFDKSYNAIECVHRITDSAAYDYVRTRKVLDKMTLLEIKNEIKEKGGDYLTDNYKNYMDFKFSFLGNNISFDLKKTYKPTGDYFSIPLFRSIEKIHGLSDDSQFEFIKASLYGVDNRIVFSVVDSKMNKHFYDFSQIPPEINEVLYYSFSPL